MNHIPSKFDSPDHFTAVYSGLLIEETRSAICASIQNLSENQYFKLLSVEKCESPSLFFLDVDLLATRSDEIQSQHVARDFDACLLSSGCPKDSDFDVMSCYLGLTVGVGRYTPFQKSFRVLVSDHEMFQPDKIKFVIFLSNIKYNMEISRMLSLHHEENQTAIKALLELHRTVCRPHSHHSLHYIFRMSFPSTLYCVLQHRLEKNARSVQLTNKLCSQ